MYNFYGSKGKSAEKIGEKFSYDKANSMPNVDKPLLETKLEDPIPCQSKEYLFNIIKTQNKTQEKMIKLISRIISNNHNID